ncbi:hypothetical protein [Sulfurimonas diazotrophicus]|uniref:Uncharacterized protein n=1 Tax=Sulfurimonas diazotrophicus TaxID=3131939 RepID=A0ABZ3HBR0_9BACT
MVNLWILPIALVILLDLAALFVVINEELLYEAHQKFYKVLFILLVPLIGAIVELYLLSRYAKFRGDGYYPDDDVKWYAFWNHFSNDSSSSGSHSGSDGSGGGDSGGGGD